MLKKFLATIVLSTALTLCVNAAEVPNIELNNGTKIHKLNTEKRIFNPPYEEAKKRYLETVLPD